MKKKIVSVLSFTTILAVFLFISACPNPQKKYAIDSLPGCDECPYVLDEAILTELVNRIEDGAYGNIHSLIIIHNDSLALEEYFMDWSRDMLHHCNSVTKSVTSALVGIAIEQDKIDGVDGKLLDFFPEYTDIANLDDRKESITLEHVLTMTAGFTWDETAPYLNPDGSPNMENDAMKLSASDDWIKYMLNLSMSDAPGTTWNYNSGCTVLLSGIIANKTGQSAEEFAKKNLFSKIGITNWDWETGPNGITNTGWGLSLHPVDMAMFGYLFLKKGQLNGKQIVPEDWVSESTREHITIIYGYQWWPLLDFRIIGHPEAKGAFYAIGYGGQQIMIIPNINMVIVTTAANPGQEEFIFDMLLDILSAVKEK